MRQEAYAGVRIKPGYATLEKKMNLGRDLALDRSRTRGVAQFEVAHEVDERLHALDRHGIVNTRTHAAHAAVALDIFRPAASASAMNFASSSASPVTNGTFISERSSLRAVPWNTSLSSSAL